MAVIKRQTINSVKENVEKLESSNNWAVFKQFNISVWPSISTLRYVTKRILSICPTHTKKYFTLHRSITYNNHNDGT